MSGNHTDPPSTLVEASFHSMEELTEFARSTGREGEYHQVGKGRVTSRWRFLRLGQFSLNTHSLDKRVHARVAPPKECMALTIMRPPFSMLVDGVELANSKVLVMDAASEADFVTPDEAECETLILPRSVFEASAQALFPRMGTNGGPVRILPAHSPEWSALLGEVRSLLRNGTTSPEDFSQLLCRFLGLIAGEAGKRADETCLGNRSTARVARLAREYVEDHYRYPIPMDDLCRHAGVSLRTLERSFADYYQVSPLKYLRTRRLNAARQALATGDPLHDNVTDIALENGFTHLGRFSVTYRKHFDESPRETLARRASSQV